MAEEGEPGGRDGLQAKERVRKEREEGRRGSSERVQR